MDEASRTTLELFVEKVERLAKYIRENDARNTIVINPGGLMGVFRNGEDKEWQVASTLDGFLVTFRMFVQPRDKIALYSLERVSQGQPKQQKPKLLDIEGLSPDWYEKVKQAYTHIDDALNIARFSYNGQSITRREILETFLYGDGVHINVTYRETLKQWRRLPDLFGDLQLEFTITLVFMFSQISAVAEACKHELCLNV
jgi:hypothetical protein